MKNATTAKFINHTDYTRKEDIKRLQFIQNGMKELEKPTLKVLDVGCGNGNISRQLGYEGHDVCGIDISENAINIAIEKNTLPNVTFKAVSAEKMDVNDKFDVIVCSEVIEHLYEPQKVLNKLYDLLESDGLLFITVPNGYGPREFFMTQPMQWAMKTKSIWAVISSIKRSMGYKGTTIQSAAGDLSHVQFFTKKSLTNLISAGGMKMKKFGVTNFIEAVFPFSLFSRKIVALQNFDCWLADKLPASLASGFLTVWIVDKERTN